MSPAMPESAVIESFVEQFGALRDELPKFVNDDVQLLAISNDAPFSLRVFAEREGLDYPLLSDFWPHGAAAKAYGVFNEETGAPIRGTFLIASDGTVVWTLVKPADQRRTEMPESLESLHAA